MDKLVCPCFSGDSDRSKRHRDAKLTFGGRIIMKSFSDEYLNNIKITPDLLSLINSLAEYKGKEELYANQTPEVLESLLEEAKVESAESSNRIEGVIVRHDRVKALVNKNSKPRGQLEEEVAGYLGVS